MQPDAEHALTLQAALSPQAARSPAHTPGQSLDAGPAARPRVIVPTASAVDFSRRADPAHLLEWMDAPCPYEEFRDCVLDIGVSNRWTFEYLPTMHFLHRVLAARGGSGQPLRVLDVGFGGGDSLRRIALWGWRRGIPLELTGVDLNPHAVRAARELSSGSDPRFAAIRWLEGDVYENSAAQECDLILSSQMSHHMRDPEIIRFLRWMESTARVGWFVNDLYRSPLAYRSFIVFSRALRLHPFVQHDGPISIRRGFRPEDWKELLGEAGVPLSAVRISSLVPGRLCVGRLR